MYISGLTRVEDQNRVMHQSLVSVEETLKNTQKELTTSREEYSALEESYSKLESELNSLRIGCNEKDEEILKLEDAAFDCYEDGFENALQQICALHPDFDLSGADSSMRVLLESFCSILYSIGVILHCQVSTNLFPLWIGVVYLIFVIIFFADKMLHTFSIFKIYVIPGLRVNPNQPCLVRRKLTAWELRNPWRQFVTILSGQQLLSLRLSKLLRRSAPNWSRS